MKPPRIVSYGRSRVPDRFDAAIEQLFFATAGQNHFDSVGAKETYRHRWLDRYFIRYPESCYVALDSAGAVVGYLAGCPCDAAPLPSYSDLGYYAAFKSSAAGYPAHSHTNVAESWRGRGVGRDLHQAFAAELAAAGIAGMHVVTGATAAAVGFYRKIGYREVERATVDDIRLVLLGRPTGW